MKRKVLAIFFACLMMFSLAACGNNASADSGDDSSSQVAVAEEPTPEAAVESTEDTKPTATVTEKPEEDKPDDAVEPTQDTVQDNTATDTDEAQPDTTGQDAVTSTADGTSADTTSTTTDQQPAQDTTPTTTDQQPAQDTTPTTTDQHPAQETTPTQTAPVTNVSTANVGSTFDVADYVYDVCNANAYYIIDHQIDITFGSWFVEISTDKYNSSLAYISIGSWDYNAYYWNNNTYSYVFNYGSESVRVTSDGGPESTVSKTAIVLLPTVVDYMKASGDPSVAPNIPGCTFKPCQSDNPFVQY